MDTQNRRCLVCNPVGCPNDTPPKMVVLSSTPDVSGASTPRVLGAEVFILSTLKVLMASTLGWGANGFLKGCNFCYTFLHP